MLVGLVEPLLIVRARMSRETLHGCGFVGEDVINSFDVRLERRLDDVSIGFDISARSRQPAALNFKADVCHLNDFDKTGFQSLRYFRWVEEGRVDTCRTHGSQSFGTGAGRHKRDISIGL